MFLVVMGLVTAAVVMVVKRLGAAHRQRSEFDQAGREVSAEIDREDDLEQYRFTLKLWAGETEAEPWEEGTLAEEARRFPGHINATLCAALAVPVLALVVCDGLVRDTPIPGMLVLGSLQTWSEEWIHLGLTSFLAISAGALAPVSWLVRRSHDPRHSILKLGVCIFSKWPIRVLLLSLLAGGLAAAMYPSTVDSMLQIWLVPFGYGYFGGLGVYLLILLITAYANEVIRLINLGPVSRKRPYRRSWNYGENPETFVDSVETHEESSEAPNVETDESGAKAASDEAAASDLMDRYMQD